MNASPKVLMIITLDTKAREAAFVRATLEAHGVGVVHLDASIRRTVEGGAEIGPESVARAAGSTLEDVRALKHEGKCQAVMTQGAITIAAELQARGEIAGVIGLGGSMGTTLATAVMRSLPYGLPKLMISTMASGFTRPFVGNRDILMLNSVCDIAGLNTISREVFRNGAVALAAMARAYAPHAREEQPLVMMSTLSTTDKCSVRVREALTQHGCEVMVFHTLGTGGMTLDDIVRERDVAAVVDLSLVEINDFLQGGLCSAGPDRAQAALKKGVPTIFAPGNIDFMVAGPIDQAKAQFPGKRYHMHNAALTAVRAETAELHALADHMAGIIAAARGPVSFLVPLKGFSAHDSEQGYLHDPSLPPVFAAHLQRVMPAGVPVVTYDCHINDEPFADAIIERVLRYTHPRHQAI
jgi:uncharacterized protein (UPF0261 family)